MSQFQQWFQYDSIQLRELEVEGYERVLEVRDASVDLHGFIAVHNTKLGPALGGVRAYVYENEEEALKDVLRLAKGMTFKAALSNTGTGGGKSVIILKKGQKKTPELLHSFAKAIDFLKGDYIGAEDVNMSTEDVARLREKTRYLVGLKHPRSSGNPAVFTARGGYRGIQAALKSLYGSESVFGKTVAIQGLGAVGMELARFLFWDGACLIVSDISEEKVQQAVKEFGATAVACDDILTVECDILAPCAMGCVFTKKTIQQLKCRAIAGVANNQLENEAIGYQLDQKKILYIPDFVINAGGLLNVSVEITKEGYSPVKAREKIDHLYTVILDLIEQGKKEGVPPFKRAESVVNDILEKSSGKEKRQATFHH